MSLVSWVFDGLPQDSHRKYGSLGLGRRSSVKISKELRVEVPTIVGTDNELDDIDDVIDSPESLLPFAGSTLSIPPFGLHRSMSLPASNVNPASTATQPPASAHYDSASNDSIIISRITKQLGEAEAARRAAEIERDAFFASQREVTRDLRRRDEDLLHATMVKEALSSEITSLSKQLGGLCCDKQDLFDRNADLEKKLKLLEDDHAVLHRDHVSALRRNSELMLAVEERERRLQNMDQERVNLRDAFSARQEADDVERAALIQRLEDTGALNVDLTAKHTKAQARSNEQTEARRTLEVQVDAFKKALDLKEKEKSLLDILLGEAKAEKEASMREVISATVNFQVEQRRAEALQRDVDAGQVREAELRRRCADLQAQALEMSAKLSEAQTETRRATDATEHAQAESVEARKRATTLQSEVADLKVGIDTLRHHVDVTESRCKVLGMELDRPMWESAKEKRERDEREAREEVARAARKRYVEKMARVEKARAAEDARVKKEAAERQRMRAEADRQAKEETERKRQEQAERERVAAENERRRQFEEENLRRAELEYQARREAKKKEAAEKERRARWEDATEREHSRCQKRDLDHCTAAPERQWHKTTALSRFKLVLQEFPRIPFSEDQPMTSLSVPWPTLLHPDYISDLERVAFNWNDVSKFMRYAKASLADDEYKKMVSQTKIAFHPDRWAGRNLLISVQDDGTRKILQDSGNIVSQAINSL